MTQSSAVPPLDANGIYTDHFQLARKPFSGADPYPCPSQEAALETLVEGLRQRRGVLMLTGEFGTGKTQLLRRLGLALGQDWELVLCYSTQLSFDELLGFVCDRLELQVQGEGRPQRLKALKTHLQARQAQGRGVALLVDEAQHLDPEVLGHLLNLAHNGFREGRSLELVLSGSLRLEERLVELGSRHPLLEQAVLARLKALEPAQVEDYIRQQISQVGGDPAWLFPPAAARQVARYARGRLRLVNALCDRALLLTQLEDQPAVTPEAVERAAAELLLDEAVDETVEGTRQQPVVAAVPQSAPEGEATAVMATASVPLAAVRSQGTQPLETVTLPPGPGPIPPRSRRRGRRVWPWLTAGGALAAGLAAYGLWPILQPPADTPLRVVESVSRPSAISPPPQQPVRPDRRQADPPRLVVAPAAGPVDQAIPLSIAASPGDNRDTLTIDIAGLPRGSSLSAGRQYSPNTWTLTVSELQGLKLYPAGGSRDFQLTVTATAIPPFAGISNEVSVDLPVSIVTPVPWDQGQEEQARVVVEQAPVVEEQAPVVMEQEVPVVQEQTPVVVEQEAPVVQEQTPVVMEQEVPAVEEQTPVVVEQEAPVVEEQAPSVEEFAAVEEPSPPSPSVVAFMASGDRLLERGDPAGARLFYEAAARTGDPRAATAVGRTYDPVELQRRGIRGAYADPLLAGQWYRQGLESQYEEAEQRLRELRDWLLENQGPDDEQLLALDRLLEPY